MGVPQLSSSHWWKIILAFFNPWFWGSPWFSGSPFIDVWISYSMKGSWKSPWMIPLLGKWYVYTCVHSLRVFLLVFWIPSYSDIVILLSWFTFPISLLCTSCVTCMYVYIYIYMEGGIWIHIPMYMCSLLPRWCPFRGQHSDMCKCMFASFPTYSSYGTLAMFDGL